MERPLIIGDFYYWYRNDTLGQSIAHSHTGIELHFCEEGDGFFRCHPASARLRPGRVTLLYAPNHHHVWSDPRKRYYRTVLQIPHSQADRAVDFLELESIDFLPTQGSPLRQFSITSDDAIEFERIFRRLYRDVTRDTAALRPGVALYIAELLYLLSHRNQTAAADADDSYPHAELLVRRAQALLEADPDCHPSPRELAQWLGVSPGHMWRVFSQVLGVSPRDHLLTRRMERARDYLLSGMTVDQVAAACHYADASSFSRAFKAHMGMSPGAYAAGQGLG